MRGTNPIRKPVMDDGSTLAVQEIFPTLQGEGPRAGEPATFIRLGGCNLACDFCDTEFESFNLMPISDLVARVEKQPSLVVITGGEPLRQNITPLCEALIARGHTVQIETNGTLFRELPHAVEIVCSPKSDPQGYHPIRPDLRARITAFKFIVSAHHPQYRDIPDIGQEDTLTFVQPMDEYDAEKNTANRAHAIALAKQHGFRLSLQLHKLLGIP